MSKRATLHRNQDVLANVLRLSGLQGHQMAKQKIGRDRTGLNYPENRATRRCLASRRACSRARRWPSTGTRKGTGLSRTSLQCADGDLVAVAVSADGNFFLIGSEEGAEQGGLWGGASRTPVGVCVSRTFRSAEEDAPPLRVPTWLGRVLDEREETIISNWLRRWRARYCASPGSACAATLSTRVDGDATAGSEIAPRSMKQERR